MADTFLDMAVDAPIPVLSGTHSILDVWSNKPPCSRPDHGVQVLRHGVQELVVGLQYRGWTEGKISGGD